MNRSRDKGTFAETAVTRYLRANGFPLVERRALSGNLDKGDIAGIPGVCWEVKAARNLTIGPWMRETETERVNARAELGILVIKPKGVGALNVDKWWTAMREDQWRGVLADVFESSYHLELRNRPHPGEKSLAIDPGGWLLMAATQAPLGWDAGVHHTPRGVQGDCGPRHHIYMYLDTLVRLLRAAGHGTPPDAP